ncbi:hypothetical protein HM1_2351 [Heliomicrobium modesticaldum Ice1]|uniref:Uncharacterized protein n=1 Tax=Heliobacterium modesticaldum (strain ATCC 51547 / Ice1) TaxID=498761 RepID=B0THU9_HELMI|nr:hypothetical protein [Heliomicrobium modesticaldum]ABZ84882.1 hypothetical protein HM1_2351 [Heliomicrobium modesticaldum Ice1]
MAYYKRFSADGKGLFLNIYYVLKLFSCPSFYCLSTRSRKERKPPMSDEIGKIFITEIREKKAAATGIHHKKGRRGQVGTMITPSDLSGKEYRSPGSIEKYHLDDLISRLQSSPVLKEMILRRMDEQYQQYRQATEETLNAITSILIEALDRFEGEAGELRRRIQRLESEHAETPSTGDISTEPTPLRWTPGKRIRWGSTPEEIKSSVFQQLQRLQEMGSPICVETIKNKVPGMLRWLYGDKAVFNGLKGLQQEYRLYYESHGAMRIPVRDRLSPEPSPLEMQQMNEPQVVDQTPPN